MKMSRRSFLLGCGTAAAGGRISSGSSLSTEGCAGEAVELVRAEILRRFVDRHGILLDFVDLDGSVSLPTPEECREGRPNALGWWTPIENGAMFNGLYLDGVIARARVSGRPEDRGLARRLVGGLLKLSVCSRVKGFVGRGFATDGATTWPMGSNDQTAPWFYGLWRYLEARLAADDERARIVERMNEVANTLVETGWRMPAEPPFGFRGSFNGMTWGGAPRLLFVCRALHRLTGDEAWLERYRIALRERDGRDGRSRLDVCSRGLAGEEGGVRAVWTGSVSAACLRGLWEMEDDPSVRAAYEAGLRATAEAVAPLLALALEFDADRDERFEPDWRKLNELWKPQKTAEEAVAVAQAQLRMLHRLSPRRTSELKLLREAVFAAWVTALCPDANLVRGHTGAFRNLVSRLRADRLRFVSFFPVEGAWWRWPGVDAT